MLYYYEATRTWSAAKRLGILALLIPPILASSYSAPFVVGGLVLALLRPAYRERLRGLSMWALASLAVQTHSDWRALIVADDLFDYQGLVRARMGDEPRLGFASTGQVRSGCHNARNVGFALIEGDFVTQLDADDEITPTRLAELLPLAKRHGAAADNLSIVDDATGAQLSRPMAAFDGVRHLDLGAFMKLNAPLVPLVARRFAAPRALGVELSEDVIANIQLLDRIGALPVLGRASYAYRVRSGSIAHADDSAARFETAYSSYIDRLEGGDGFGLTAHAHATARDGLIAKRALNRAFDAARRRDPALNFQEFAARFA